MRDKRDKCESCGKHPVAYWVGSYIKGRPAHKECCVCVDTRVTTLGPAVKDILNIRPILQQSSKENNDGDRFPTISMKWNPMSTAPKDGTRIMLAAPGGAVWCDCFWEKMKRVPDRWSCFLGMVPFEPVAWMPKPKYEKGQEKRST